MQEEQQDIEETEEFDAPEEIEQDAPPVDGDLADDGGESDAAPPPQWSAEEAEEAKALGWRPPEEWKGDLPPNFAKTPAEYLDRVKKSPVYRAMQTQIERTREEFQRIERAVQAGAKREQERMHQAYAHRIRQIEAGQRRAAEEGDLEAYDRLSEMRRNTRLPQADPPEFEDAPRENPLEPLAKEKQWLNDPYLVKQGEQIIDAALRSGELRGGDAATQVDFAEKRLKAYYPHLFEAPKTEPRPARVDGGGFASKQKTAFDKLPKDARDVFSRQVKQGIFSDTKEDRDFFAGEYNG